MAVTESKKILFIVQKTPGGTEINKSNLSAICIALAEFCTSEFGVGLKYKGWHVCADAPLFEANLTKEQCQRLYETFDAGVVDFNP